MAFADVAGNAWQDVCTEPEEIETGRSPAQDPQDPEANTDEDQSHYVTDPKCASILVRLKYNDDTATNIVSPIIIVWGKSESGDWEKLQDINGTFSSHTLTVAIATDLDDGTFKYTDPLEIFLARSRRVLFAVTTAFSSDHTVNDSTIQAKQVIRS